MKKTKDIRKFKKGFTLIELLLAVSILGIAFGVTSDILISLVRSKVKTQVSNNLEQQANFFALKLEKDLRNAYAVSTANDLNYCKSIDCIKISEKANGVTYTVYYSYMDPGVLFRKEGTYGILAITSTVAPGGVSVSCNIEGSCFSVSGVAPTNVSVNIRFSPATSGADAVTPATGGYVDIQSTYVVRGTY